MLLIIFVEGNDDERFFERIVVPVLKKKFDSVKLVKYAQMKKERLESYIRSITSAGWDYIYVTDMDDSPCVTARKQQIQNYLPNIDPKRVVVVIREIESWYLAGLNKDKSRDLKIKERKLKNTENITKEQFNRLIPEKYSRINFMIELLENFSIETAKQKNRSFKYFVEKFCS
ncbi:MULTISPECIES: DUF4276 family protein [Thermotoga]|jgi:hypothetical protein|uniref:DUF4276 family protein n=1 Tax=Thermotoga neapolitana (strain ATCC 49049 / DSM 4359 / NBRC 107923 / NS-E) TaxID=309803 RepID=B9KB28_THENN|nr:MULTISPECIES: DUF4276 family protein [Thermotoga]ACM22224.1 Putative uncharacterized protein [Thermotoga neapolitana DSM 4359]AJG40191.1 hypothetical protein TRQ7_01725 [Thermotoga sp. RQ7]KFZ22620.1 hypothetical protein LA10_00065 [Thermotoga neapolitana LA10]KHC90374.1 hypothetical protein Mc24_08439 [Thermotoga sp. Mc24]